MEQAETKTVWNGRRDSYRPESSWRECLSSELPLHENVATDVDPVTLEVIRHRLWTINTAHGDTVTRISGSPVFASLDFNMCVLTEDAEVVMNAPYIQFLNSGAPYGVRFIMERFAENPGIEEGDVFICNDPWIGAVHQMDVLFACPVFVDGKIFAWVCNAGHQYDLGGITPGGWPQNAEDVYQDPVVFPPFKIVERGVIRKDLEQMYLRQSRMPDLVALDFRAQLSGCRFASEQMTLLCEQFGAATVKAAMRRILDDAQSVFAQKLEMLPDGKWSQVQYLDERLPGDRSNYRVQINITKTGSRLLIDNKGTDLQTVGPLGITFLCFAASVISVLSVTMLYESLFATGGGSRQIDHDVEPGLLNSVQHPAAVSAGLINVATHMGMVQSCVARMLTCSDELRGDAVAPAPDYVVPVVSGVDDRGKFYGSAILDHFAMGSGARAESDGVDTGGASWSPLGALLNVEAVELWYPLIYLWRRELADSGGAGRFRGGVGLVYGWTPYRAESMEVMTFGGGMCISAIGAGGVLGGFPSPSAWTTVKKQTDLLKQFGGKVVPKDIDSVGAKDNRILSLKTNGIDLVYGDVAESVIVGGGGYGDPLEREAVMVAGDVRNEYVSVSAANSVYGVALTADGGVDTTATTKLRAAQLRARALWPSAQTRWPGHIGEPSVTPATGTPARPVHEYIVARDRDGQRILACRKCDQMLCDYRDNYRSTLLSAEDPVTVIPGVNDPTFYHDEPMVFRQYCCPGCQVLMSTEVVRQREGLNPEVIFS